MRTYRENHLQITHPRSITQKMMSKGDMLSHYLRTLTIAEQEQSLIEKRKGNLRLRQDFYLTNKGAKLGSFH